MLRLILSGLLAVVGALSQPIIIEEEPDPSYCLCEDGAYHPACCTDNQGGSGGGGGGGW